MMDMVSPLRQEGERRQGRLHLIDEIVVDLIDLPSGGVGRYVVGGIWILHSFL